MSHPRDPCPAACTRAPARPHSNRYPAGPRPPLRGRHSQGLGCQPAPAPAHAPAPAPAPAHAHAPTDVRATVRWETDAGGGSRTAGCPGAGWFYGSVDCIVIMNKRGPTTTVRPSTATIDPVPPPPNPPSRPPARPPAELCNCNLAEALDQRLLCADAEGVPDTVGGRVGGRAPLPRHVPASARSRVGRGPRERA